MADPNEKRKSPRIAKTLTIQYISKKTANWYTANLKNISADGACLLTDEGFVSSDSIDIRIKIPLLPLEWIEIKSRVIKSDTFASGMYLTRVEFKEIAEKQKEIFKEYITKMAPIKSPLDQEKDANRTKKILIIRYGFLSDTNNILWNQAKVININLTGLAINTAKPFALNTTVYLAITFPTHPLESISLRGRVGSSEETTQGLYKTVLYFLDLEGKENIIREYVDFVSRDN